MSGRFSQHKPKQPEQSPKSHEPQLDEFQLEDMNFDDLGLGDLQLDDIGLGDLQFEDPVLTLLQDDVQEPKAREMDIMTDPETEAFDLELENLKALGLDDFEQIDLAPQSYTAQDDPKKTVVRSKQSKLSKHSKEPKTPKPSKKPVNTGVLILSVILVVVVLAMAVLIGCITYRAVMKQAEQRKPTIPPTETLAVMELETEAPEETLPLPTTMPYKESGMDIINILVIGQAERKGEKQETSKLADTMILMTVNKNTKTLTLTSFLRDAYVQLPNFKSSNGKNKMNVCYHLGYLWGDTGGAMQKVNECIKMNFGIEVDYDVEVDFEGFMGLIDILDGIEMEVTEAEANYMNKDKRYVYYEIKPGVNILDGMAALSYARMRHATGDGGSDIKRTARQRKLISAVVDEIKDLSFSQLQDMVETALPLITTNMTNEQITTCMWEILPLLPQLKIESGTCPVETTYWPKEVEMGGYITYPQEFHPEQQMRLMMPITEGREFSYN